MPKQPPLLDLRNVRVMRGNVTRTNPASNEGTMYEGKIVLNDFTLRIDSSEHVAVLGPNGCGKSTLIKTITRECYPVVREGSSMTILGRTNWNVFELRSLLGIVSNDLMSSCTADASGLDVVLSGFFSSTRIFPNHSFNSEQREMAEAALADLGVSHLADRAVEEMSSGEAKRVLIARALVHKPRALLFDEPCNSLDILAQRSLRETMRSLAQSAIGIILVTHELPDIVPEIERVVLMAKGRIVADGRKEDVLKAERLSKLFGLKVELARRDGYYYIG
ncbi:MAG TPA: ATP-binding cassette domain-containing protein [Terriglobales bacterium]|nr:ATP-binding cassette domain-containing protein [Terriglobales bacterium]